MFQLSFVLSDDNLYQGTTNYEITIKVIENQEYVENIEEEEINYEPPPLIKYEMDRDDNIIVSFTQDIIYP